MPTDDENTEQDETGPGDMGPDSTGPDSTGPDSTGPDSTGPDSTGPDSTGPGSTGPDSTGPGSTGPGSTGPGSTGPDSTEQTAAEELRGWFTGRLPGEWFTEPVDVVLDREEIAVVGTVADPEVPADSSDATRSAAVEGRVRRFREQTRERRIDIAREAEHRFGRKVSWGVVCRGQKAMFTTVSIPVMTRLRQPERRVLDTLVEAGVARSRSDALAWCVRLVGKNIDAWLEDLRAALRRVEQVRAEGPDA